MNVRRNELKIKSRDEGVKVDSTLYTNHCPMNWNYDVLHPPDGRSMPLA